MRVVVSITAGLALIIGLAAVPASAQVPPLPVDLPVDGLPVDDLPVDVPDLDLPLDGPLAPILACLSGDLDLPDAGGLLEAEVQDVDAIVASLLCVLEAVVDLLTSALGGDLPDLPAPDVPAPDVPLP